MPCRHRGGSKGVAPLILSVGAGWWKVNATLRSLYPLEKAAVTIVQEAWWPPVPVWTVVEKKKALTLTGVRTPNRSTRTESLKDYAVPASAVYQLLFEVQNCMCRCTQLQGMHCANSPQ